ncbi:MAG: hypothetical protein NT027_03125, partial [Proteobacteria bacterium]|nr:hypothetical protein [Pseudomonadota bacterium]
ALFGKPMQSPDYGDGYNVHIIESLELSDQDLQRAKKDLGDLHLSELYRVFPWERGVGPTQSCGTGACAVAAAILNLGFTVRSSWIAIDMPGGRLYVKQDQEDGPVILAGPASFVFAGTIEI